MFRSPGAIAFSIFGIDIMWYGIMVTGGILAAAVFTYFRAPGFGIRKDHFIDILLFAVPIGILGARLYYIIFNWDVYAGDFMKMINFREGGLAIHGGLIFAVITALIACRVCGENFLDFADLAAPGIALGQAIGRWGNFFNSEAYGSATDLPWAVYIEGTGYVHPTFLYESLWCLLLFLFLWAYSGHRKFGGQLICLYVIFYSAERFLVEALRTDSLMIGPFKQARVLSLILILAAAAAYIILSRRKKNSHEGQKIQ